MNASSAKREYATRWPTLQKSGPVFIGRHRSTVRTLVRRKVAASVGVKRNYSLSWCTGSVSLRLHTYSPQLKLRTLCSHVEIHPGRGAARGRLALVPMRCPAATTPQPRSHTSAESRGILEPAKGLEHSPGRFRKWLTANEFWSKVVHSQSVPAAYLFASGRHESTRIHRARGDELETAETLPAGRPGTPEDLVL